MLFLMLFFNAKDSNVFVFKDARGCVCLCQAVNYLFLHATYFWLELGNHFIRVHGYNSSKILKKVFFNWEIFYLIFEINRVWHGGVWHCLVMYFTYTSSLSPVINSMAGYCTFWLSGGFTLWSGEIWSKFLQSFLLSGLP